MSATNKLTQQILDYLFNRGMYVWRQNSGGIFDRKTGKMRASTKKGVPDIIGFTPEGKFIGVEIKTGKDQLRPEQKGFLTSLQKSNGLALVVGNFDEFLDIWNSQYSRS